MANGPTQRTLQWARKQGWTAAVAERWCGFSRRRIDLFGFVDIVAVSESDIVAIQCTSTGNVSHRIAKINTECREAARGWLKAGGRILVVGWKKYARKQDGRAWRETVREITLEDLEKGP